MTTKEPDPFLLRLEVYRKKDKRLKWFKKGKYSYGQYNSILDRITGVKFN